MMTERIIIAGSGGQGIMLLGKLLAQSALIAQKHTTWFPCYGAEVRGGSAYCMVVISDKEIASPLIEKPDTLIVFNQQAFLRFKEKITNQTLVIVNQSLAGEVKLKAKKIINVPLSEIAHRLGNVRVANCVAFGVYLAEKKLFSLAEVFSAMKELAGEGKEDLIALNQKAIEEGLRYGSR
ncbi:MAG: 2-oxoacid:acceptor oxidoreductase family protein [Candidatus Omnitrophica bacterium]|nr:2-oxoacid:acceptor oxidoreductase family protein [Candidatus Omnitrophota bacterium]